MSFGRYISLPGGGRMSQIGFGTWLSKPNEVGQAVEEAVRNGYRHLDFAIIYGNQVEIGAALKNVIPSVVKREELFLTSKLWNTSHRSAQVEKELDYTLNQLGTDYLDLYLIHWPVAFPPDTPPCPITNTEVIDKGTTLVDTWRAMIALLDTGKVKAIGVSNFTIEQLQGIIHETGVTPAVNQVEAHPHLPQDDLVAFCKEKGIHITAYSSLGNNLLNKPQLTEHPVIQEVASQMDATPAQVLIAWGVYRGYSVIPKSVNKDRIITNFKQVELSKENYEKITAIGKEHIRFNIPIRYAPKWDVNVFDEPSEKGAATRVKIQ